MTDQQKKEICDRILGKNDIDLVGFFSFICARIERIGLNEDLEYRLDVAYKEILRRMSKEG